MGSKWSAPSSAASVSPFPELRHRTPASRSAPAARPGQGTLSVPQTHSPALPPPIQRGYDDRTRKTRLNSYPTAAPAAMSGEATAIPARKSTPVPACAWNITCPIPRKATFPRAQKLPTRSAWFAVNEVDIPITLGGNTGGVPGELNDHANSKWHNGFLLAGCRGGSCCPVMTYGGRSSSL